MVNVVHRLRSIIGSFFVMFKYGNALKGHQQSILLVVTVIFNMLAIFDSPLVTFWNCKAYWFLELHKRAATCRPLFDETNVNCNENFLCPQLTHYSRFRESVSIFVEIWLKCVDKWNEMWYKWQKMVWMTKRPFRPIFCLFHHFSYPFSTHFGKMFADT